jgi:hypothetical protein
MSNCGATEDSALESPSEDLARIVLEDRPEVVACLDGLAFRGKEAGMIALLRASLLNLSSEVLIDLEEEDEMPALIGDLQDRIHRMVLAVKALDWELQARKDPELVSKPRYAGYRVEILELLRGHLPPFELSPREKEALAARAKASLEMELRRGGRDGDAKAVELRAILDDLAGNSAAPASMIARLPRPRLAEWLSRWVEESSGGEERSILRDMEIRLLDSEEPGFKVEFDQPVVPRR